MCIHPNILSPSTIPMSFVWSLEISSSWWWRSKKFLTDFFFLATKSQQQQIRNVFKSHSGNDDDDRSQTTKKDFPSTDKVSLFSSSCRGLDSAKVRLLSLPLLPTYVRRFFGACRVDSSRVASSRSVRQVGSDTTKVGWKCAKAQPKHSESNISEIFDSASLGLGKKESDKNVETKWNAQNVTGKNNNNNNDDSHWRWLLVGSGSGSGRAASVTRFIVQYLAIPKTLGVFHNKHKTFVKVGSTFCQMLNKPTNMTKGLKFRQIWSHLVKRLIHKSDIWRSNPIKILLVLRTKRGKVAARKF